MKKFKYMWLLLLLCVPVMAGFPGISMKSSASSADDKKAKLFAPDPERALVYAFRDNSFLGSSAGTQLVINNVAVTKSGKNEFVVVSLAAGQYNLSTEETSKGSNAATFMIHNKSKAPVPLTAEVGKIYYFQEIFHPSSGFTLKELSAEQAQPLIKKEKMEGFYKL